jgi:hypothetical protein
VVVDITKAGCTERVHLLNHILGMIVEPNENQHPDIRKLNLSVKKLEECTHEALSGFFAESNANASKKQYLNEIFRVARQQERFKKGEIGTFCYPPFMLLHSANLAYCRRRY